MEYNFIKCLRPQRIRNKYTGEIIITPCGRCEACRLKQAYTRTLKCNLESLSHKYQYFVTLTYDNDSVPTIKLVPLSYNGLDYEVVRYRCNHIASDGSLSHYISGDSLGSVTLPNILAMTQLQKKMKFINENNEFYSLDYYDVQLFIKRLRKRIKNERIRVFTCGEYGPVHFRPHYHLLLWFSNEETFQNIQQYIAESWPFGIVDASLSYGKSSSYVARYVNGSQYLPSLLKVRGTKPFSHHSRFLGEAILQSNAETFQSDDYRRIAKRRLSYDGFNSDVVLWRSIKDRLFPRCSGFTIKSEHECVMSYRLIETTRKWLGKDKTISIARKIGDYVDRFDSESPFPIVHDLLEYWLKKYLIGHPPEKEIFDKEKFIRMVYVELLKSARFIRVQCHGNSDYKVVQKQYHKVKEFYKVLDYDNLVGQLKYVDKTPFELRHYYYTDLCMLVSLKKEKIYEQFVNERKSLYRRLMKHRELNDKNLFFNY